MTAEVRPETTTPAVQRQPLQKINKDAGENFSDLVSAFPSNAWGKWMREKMCRPSPKLC